MMKQNAVVLFQGDSITDWGRDRNDYYSLGTGYAMMCGAWINSLYPELNITFLNRGIGGNRVKDLESRWQRDCIDLKPDVVSILIGINDTWRRFDNNDPTPVENFEASYRSILTEVKEKTSAQLIICEPFLLPVTEEQKKFWREDLDPKINAARTLAMEFGAIYIPFDGVFAAACMKQPPSYWAADGVHPTPAGFALMSRHWIAAFEELLRRD
ncbi:MAG: SGNH/GDSL hydrolase family protein [Acetivibrionales bacterium]|jgi:acyl-CoA thioesterase-1